MNKLFPDDFFQSNKKQITSSSIPECGRSVFSDTDKSHLQENKVFLAPLKLNMYNSAEKVQKTTYSSFIGGNLESTTNFLREHSLKKIITTDNSLNRYRSRAVDQH